MFRVVSVVVLLLVLAAAACQQATSANDGAAPAADSTDAAADPAESAGTDDGVTMRYSCEEGHSVAIIRGETARVSLADGRVVDIPRIADSAPPRYSGVALSFDIGSDGATLGQHEVGGFACGESD